MKKTKFILHGGMTSHESPSNGSFFIEFSKTLKDGDTVLYVGFARESNEEQEGVFQRDKIKILAHSNKQLNIVKSELADFAEQLQNADGVYVTGGTSKTLKERLLICPNFTDSLKGKVYAGSSAGANVISKYHTSYATDELQKGLGILPICVMAHYGNAEFNAGEERKKLFDDYIDKYELVLLPECEWVVKEIEI